MLDLPPILLITVPFTADLAGDDSFSALLPSGMSGQSFGLQAVQLVQSGSSFAPYTTNSLKIDVK